MEKIKELEETPIIDKYDNCYGTRIPTNREIVDKVNEIIETINNIIDILETNKILSIF